MPRVTFVKKAVKDNPAVKKGESYYWWKFRNGGKHYSVTPPKRSQLTQSSFLSQMYSIEDQLSSFNGESVDDIEAFVDDIKSEIENLLDECNNSLDSIPDSLRDTHMLNDRISCVEDMISTLDCIDADGAEDISDVVAEINNISYGGE